MPWSLNACHFVHLCRPPEVVDTASITKELVVSVGEII